MGVCIVIALFCVVKADVVAKWAFDFRKKDWHLQESSIPKLVLICRVWNAVMLIVLIYLFWTLFILDTAKLFLKTRISRRWKGLIIALYNNRKEPLIC